MALNRSILENGFKDLIAHPAKTPTEYANRLTNFYFQYSLTATPTPVVAGRNLAMQASLAGAFSGPGDPTRCITAYILALSAFWLGVPVPGGVVTAFLGGPILNSTLSALFPRIPTSQAIAILTNGFDAATRLVQYTISPGPPAFLV